MAKFDLVGDIHGHADELEELLKKMGYIARGDGYTHPERKLILIGDLIDRGPQQKRVVDIARSMVESGDAVVVMGNHEFNAICYATPLPGGGYVRPHTAKNNKQHEAFLAAYPEGSLEYDDAIGFFKTLPLWLEGDEFGVIHACWHPVTMKAIAPFLDDQNRIANDDFYQQFGREEEPVYSGTELLLKGPEVGLPEGASFNDKDGNPRKEARINWWKGDQGKASAFAIPDELHLEHDLSEQYATSADYFYSGEKPVFFGHYWQKGFAEPQALTGNAVCLDYSIGKGGELVAARWNSGGLDAVEWFVVKRGEG